MDLTLSTFMPHLAGLRVEHLAASADGIAITLRSSAPAAPCPLCQHPSAKRHSQYTRRMADLPWSGVGVVLHVHTRKFFCLNKECARRVFCERLPALVPAYGRRTHPLQAWLRRVGFALGGQPGARLSQAQSIPTGRTSLLQLVCTTPLPAVPTPRVLGVDDWSWKRGRSYGTLLVDLERRRAVDLLPTRTADAFAQWLTAHPGVEIISRDRAGAYAEGGRRGAPAAMQVADRFHLVMNLRTAVQEMVGRHHAGLRQAQQTVLPPPESESATLSPAPPPRAPSLTREQQRSQDRRARRKARYEEILALQEEGHSLRAIAALLDIGRQTVRRFVRADSFPERQARTPRLPKCAPYEAYLRARWDAGCQEAATLWREIRALGYTGSESGLRQYLRRWRTAPGRPGPRGPRVVALCPPAPPPQRTFSVRQTTWLLLRDPSELDTEEAAFLRRLCALCPTIATTLLLAQEFRRMVRTRDHAALAPWLEQAEASAVPELCALATSLRTDCSAVDAALLTEWSNGQLEGGVNKLKTLKRQMYGRAGFGLLRQRLLNAS